MTARAHDCEEILQPTFRPRGDADSLELFRLKNDFMYSVFNKCLLSDMGKTIVRKHLDNMNAEQVWEEFATHMTASSEGKAEKRRLHTYVTTTVLDKSWKGTTEQFILHFNEQFRQLDEVSHPIGFSSTELDEFEVDLKVVDLKVDLKVDKQQDNVRLGGLTSLNMLFL